MKYSILFLILITTACSKNSEEKFNPVMLQFNHSKYENNSKYSGEISLYPGKKDEIIIFLNQNKEPNAEFLFILQSHDIPTSLKEINYKTGEIIFLDSSLVIYSSMIGQPTFVLSIEENPKKSHPDFKNFLFLEGFGLSKHNYSQRIPGLKLSVEDFKENKNNYLSIYEYLRGKHNKIPHQKFSCPECSSSCTSGGPGASSCSLSNSSQNCSVSCRSNCYACCGITSYQGVGSFIFCQCCDD